MQLLQDQKAGTQPRGGSTPSLSDYSLHVLPTPATLSVASSSIDFYFVHVNGTDLLDATSMTVLEESHLLSRERTLREQIVS